MIIPKNGDNMAGSMQQGDIKRDTEELRTDIAQLVVDIVKSDVDARGIFYSRGISGQTIVETKYFLHRTIRNGDPNKRVYIGVKFTDYENGLSENGRINEGSKLETFLATPVTEVSEARYSSYNFSVFFGEPKSRKQSDSYRKNVDIVLNEATICGERSASLSEMAFSLGGMSADLDDEDIQFAYSTIRNELRTMLGVKNSEGLDFRRQATSTSIESQEFEKQNDGILRLYAVDESDLHGQALEKYKIDTGDGLTILIQVYNYRSMGVTNDTTTSMSFYENGRHLGNLSYRKNVRGPRQEALSNELPEEIREDIYRRLNDAHSEMDKIGFSSGRHPQLFPLTSSTNVMLDKVRNTRLQPKDDLSVPTLRLGEDNYQEIYSKKVK